MLPALDIHVREMEVPAGVVMVLTRVRRSRVTRRVNHGVCHETARAYT